MLKDINNDHICLLIEEDEDDDEGSSFVAEQTNVALNRKTNEVTLRGGRSSEYYTEWYVDLVLFKLIPWDNV